MTKIISFVILFAICLSLLTSCNQENTYYTENIEDYNSTNYPIESFDVLPKEIPNSADAISYYYYDNSRCYNICLQLKFNSIEEIDSYVASIKEDFLSKHGDKRVVKDNGWAISEPNPYNSNFTDLLLTHMEHSSLKWCYSDFYCVGYSLRKGADSSSNRFDGRFQTLSYSYEDLTVFSFYFACTYSLDLELDSHELMPQYFIHFNVPLDREVYRWHYLNYGY